jgi:hypothetical protein
MKIDEKFFLMFKSDINLLISHLFSPDGQAGGFHRSVSGGLFSAKHPPAADSFALKCLAYESLRLVQSPGIAIELHKDVIWRDLDGSRCYNFLPSPMTSSLEYPRLV